MALILGIQKGRSIYIGHTKVSVERIRDDAHFTLRVHGGMDRLVEITDEYAEELLPDVFVSAGLDGSMDLARIVINAPSHIKIWRDTLYKEKFGERAVNS